MKPLYLVAVIAVLTVSCSKKKNALHVAAPSETIVFHQNTELIIHDLPDELVKSKHYINLDMDKEKNYLGIISKASVTKNKIYLLDKRLRKLVIFDRKGKYEGMIDRLHKDYANMSYFDVDTTGIIYVIDGKLDNLLTYDAALHLTNLKKSPFEADIIQRLNSNNFLVGLSSWNKQTDAGDQIVFTDSNLIPIKTILRYDENVDDNYWITEYRFIKTDKSIFYNKSVDNNVYAFSLKGELQKIYRFDFGPMNVPNADKKNIQASIAKYDKYRLLTDFTVVNNKYAIGKIYDRQNFRFFYLDRIAHRLFLEDLTLPNALKHIADFDGTHLFTFINPGDFDETAFGNLPIDAKQHLQKGGIVFCDYELN